MLHKNHFSRFALVLLIILCLTSLSGALAEEQVRFNTNSRIYQEADLSSRYTSVDKDTKAARVATLNGWAMVRVNGAVGYTRAAHLTIETEFSCDATEYSDRVIARRTKVYAKPSTSARSLKVSKGMAVRLVASRGNWSLVENAGNYAYIKSADLTKPERVLNYSSLLKDAQDAVILQNTRVYAWTSTSSRSLRVSKGMYVRLLAYSGDWALVENAGNYAFMKASQVAVTGDSFSPIIALAATAD